MSATESSHALRSLRVLFMHGLESGPTGAKAAYLKSRFTHVEVPDMEMASYRLDKRNSFVRGYLQALTSFSWPSQWGSIALGHSMHGCLAVQKEAIQRFRPDLVIGSSWGGAIALLALATEAWQGPTLLLAPALKMAINKLGEPEHAEYRYNAVCDAIQSSGVSSNVMIVHGDADTTVSLQDSLEFGQRTGAKVHVIPGGDHGLNTTLLDNDKLIEFVCQLMRRCPSPSHDG